MKLEGKVALVTGGSAGIGEAIAHRFAAEGATVAVVASADLGKAERVAGAIGRAGGTARAFRADIAQVGEVERVVAEVLDAFGRVDILINCAGIVDVTPAGETDEAGYDRIMDINVKGTFFCVNALVPHMKARRSGRIVNVSSIGGLAGNATRSVYCASKAGVIALTKALACELAPHGIRVNAIAPGHTATPGNAHLRDDPSFAAHIETITQRTPSGRAWSEPDDMARAALFLACDDSRAMHGAIMVVDEGYTAGF